MFWSLIGLGVALVIIAAVLYVLEEFACCAESCVDITFRVLFAGIYTPVAKPPLRWRTKAAGAALVCGIATILIALYI
jgi:hypothetical protein